MLPRRIPRPPRSRPSSKAGKRAGTVCLALLWALATSFAQPASASPAADSGASPLVYIARRGWHIDIGVAVGDLTPPLDAVANDFVEVRYVFFGFGDKRYLSAGHHNAPVLLAALWPGSAVILATALAGSPAEGFGEGQVISLTLRADQMRALQSFIWNSLITADQRLGVYKEGPYEDSRYYLATAKYSALHTCNTWAAQALRAAGLRVRTSGVVLAGQLWSQARRLRRAEASAEASRASLLMSQPH